MMNDLLSAAKLVMTGLACDFVIFHA